MEKERGFNFSRISKKKIFNIIFFILFIMLDFKIIMNINMESINLKQAFIILFENVLALVVLLRNESADKKNTFIIRIINVFSVFASPFGAMVLGQLIVGDGTWGLYPEYICINLILYMCVYIILFMIIKKAHITICLYFMLVSVLALTNYFVNMFRGTAFVLMDINSVGTALEVVGNYRFEISTAICLCLFATLIFLLYQIDFQTLDVTLLGINSGWLRCVIVLGIVIGLYCGKKFFEAEDLYMWAINGEYINKGYLYKLLNEFKYLEVQKPEGYSIEKVDESISELVGDKNIGTKNMLTTPKNLIVIMNESLADFGEFSNYIASEDVLSYIHSLNGNARKGFLYVPSFGGGTSDTEYEVLTGNSKEFMPVGSNAYQLYCKRLQYGLANTLKEQNYTTIAIHPYYANGWNRPQVYSKMQFDEFITLENWGEEINNIREYASDRSAYNKIKHIVENKDDENLFIFCVTMQNHGGYDENSANGFKTSVSLSYSAEYPMAETYLSLEKESDAAFKELVEYFESVDEPTMLVMYGDHWPSLEEGFFWALFEKDVNTLNWKEVQQEHRTPYIIWTNYTLDSENEDMSSNYFGSYILEQAGLELTEYNRALLSMKEKIPIIGTGAICDSMGKWYKMDELPKEYEELVNCYKIVQYNNVFDRKNRVDSVFDLN